MNPYLILDLSKQIGSMSRADYEQLLDPSNTMSSDEIIKKLRQMILQDGLPDPEGVCYSFLSLSSYFYLISKQIENDRDDGIRSRVWKILLRIPKVDADGYIALVSKKKSEYYTKIRDDTFRTLGKDDKFKQGVAEVKLVRVLNAFVHYAQETKASISYVQGMSLILAPFLYVMPEVDAFYCFRRFVICCCPNYFTGQLAGVHVGLQVCLFQSSITSIESPYL